jgi:hypothetical protein
VKQVQLNGLTTVKGLVSSSVSKETMSSSIIHQSVMMEVFVLLLKDRRSSLASWKARKDYRQVM